MWIWQWLCHLDNPGVLHKTPTLKSFLDLEPGLWHWALPYHHMVVGRLGGHLLCLEYISRFFWSAITFNSLEALRSKVDTRSRGTPASSSSFTQMWEVSSLRHDLRSKEWSSWNTYGFACQGFLPEGNAQFWDLLLHQLELFEFVSSESKAIPLTSV